MLVAGFQNSSCKLRLKTFSMKQSARQYHADCALVVGKGWFCRPAWVCGVLKNLLWVKKVNVWMNVKT
jgi:hypothetical protein